MLIGNHSNLISEGLTLFDKKSGLNALHQDIAETMLPARATFTSENQALGVDLTRGMETSIPFIASRTFCDFLGTLFNNPNIKWGSISVDGEANLGREAKSYLEWVSDTMRRFYYSPETNITKARSELRRDYGTFGMACNRIGWNMKTNMPYMTAQHLRDVAWSDDGMGNIVKIFRKWSPTLHQLASVYGKDSLSSKRMKDFEKNRSNEIKCYHIMCLSEDYDGSGYDGENLPWVSLVVDIEEEHVIEEVGSVHEQYHIPRWAEIEGSQYAYSPATMAALPDARMLHAMNATLLDAGEISVRPAILAQSDVVRSDINFYSGGITHIDGDYDERMGKALQTWSGDGNIPWGVELIERVRDQLYEGFYLNKLNLPETSGMTAYESSKRIEEYVRSIQPLTDPSENELNGKMYNMLFKTLKINGVFGREEDVPEELYGRGVKFEFITSVSSALKEQKAQIFAQGVDLVNMASQTDPNARHIVDLDAGVRASLDGMGFDADWTRDDDEVAAIIQAEQEAMQEQQEMNQMQQMAEVANKAAPIMDKVNA